MKTITLKKMEVTDFILLQKMLGEFMTIKRNEITGVYNNEYFNNLLFIDVSTILMIRLRTKIENQNQKYGALKLKIHEAVILLQCCSDYNKKRNDYDIFSDITFTQEIHKQLINL